jgi:hypothetical protein
MTMASTWKRGSGGSFLRSSSLVSWRGEKEGEGEKVDGEDRDGGVVQKIKQEGSRGAGWRWSRCGGHALDVLSPEEGDNREKRR